MIIAVGTRLQDFTTGSWTAFDKTARIVALNAARHDAGKHRAAPVVGDAKLGLDALGRALGEHKADGAWLKTAQAERAKWDAYVAENVKPGNRPNSYAQAIGVVNALCDPTDRVVAAAGGLPAEVTANWRTLKTGSVDVEFGYSCMGYEISGGWGARIAQSEREPEQDTIIFTGDGSYLMLNSDIYSSVLSDKKLIILVLDNGGFAVINKLQNGTGKRELQQPVHRLPDGRVSVPGGLRRPRPRDGCGGRGGGYSRRSWGGVQARKGGGQDLCDLHGRGRLRRLDGGRPHLVGGRHAAGLRQYQGRRGAPGDRVCQNAPEEGRVRGGFVLHPHRRSGAMGLHQRVGKTKGGTAVLAAGIGGGFTLQHVYEPVEFQPICVLIAL